MLTYTFESRGELPLYEYLYQRISQDIRNGIIKPNEKLPSKRAFAKHLGVSNITIENAYSQLIAEGFITTKERKGYYACQLPANASSLLESSSIAFNTKESANKEFELDSTELNYLNEPLERLTSKTSQSEVISLINGVASDIFPFNAWAKSLRDALSQESEQELVTESTIQGSLKLRTVLCEYLKNNRGMNVSPEQIVIGAGAQYLYSLIAQFLGESKTIALEDPGYDVLYKVYKSHGHNPTPISLDAQGINIEKLKASNANVAHIVPSHQFPTGMITSISRRYDLLSWASQDNERIIIEDDYDCEFRLAGKPVPPLCNLDTQEQVIYTNTFTKSLGPAFRIAYMVLPKRLVKPYLESLGFYSCPVSAIDQLALAHFIQSGNYERHINRTKNKYRSLRNALIEALNNTKLAKSLVYKSQDAGLHFVLGLRGRTETTQELIIKAEEQGVLIKSLFDPVYLKGTWDIEDNNEQWFFVNYGGITEEFAPTIAKALEIAWG